MESSEKWVGQNSMPFLSPVLKGFGEPFELAFHFLFYLPKELDASEKSLSSDVGRRGFLEDWGWKNKKEMRFRE